MLLISEGLPQYHTPVIHNLSKNQRSCTHQVTFQTFHRASPHLYLGTVNGRVAARLQETTKTVISMAFLVLNLKKMLNASLADIAEALPSSYFFKKRFACPKSIR